MSVLRLPSAGGVGKLAFPSVNWCDPINKRLVVANHVDSIEGRDLVSGQSFKWYTNSVGAAPISTPARVGRAVACLHDYGYWGGGVTYNPIAATDDVTVLVWAREDFVTNRGFFRRGRDGSGNGWSLYLKTENSACNPSFGAVWTSPSLVGRAVTNSAASINAGTGSDGMWLLGRYLQGRSLSIFCGNGTVAHDTSSVGSSMRTSTQGIALTGNTSATADNGNFVNFYGTVGNDQFIWARGLSDDECWDILADPMRVYRRPPTLVFFDSAGSGGETVVTTSASGRLRSRASATVAATKTTSCAGRERATGAASTQPIKAVSVVGRERARGSNATASISIVSAVGRCRARGSNATAPISIVSAVGRRSARGSTSASQVAPGIVVTSAVGRERVRGSNTATSIRTVTVVGRRRARGADAASSIRSQLAAGRVRARGATTAAPIVAGTVVTSAAGRLRARSSSSCTTTRVTALAGRVRARGSDAVAGFRAVAVAGRRRARGAASAGPAGVLVDSIAASRLWVRGSTAAVAMPPLVLVPARVCIGAQQPANVSINASILACDCN